MNQNVIPHLMPHSGIIWQACDKSAMPDPDMLVLAINADNEAGIGELYYDERHGFFCATQSGQIDGVTKWAHITDYVFPELYADNEAHMKEYLTKFYRHPTNRVLRYAFVVREKDSHLRLARVVQLQCLPSEEDLSWAAFYAAKESGKQNPDFMQGWGAAIDYVKKLMQIE